MSGNIHSYIFILTSKSKSTQRLPSTGSPGPTQPSAGKPVDELENQSGRVEDSRDSRDKRTQRRSRGQGQGCDEDKWKGSGHGRPKEKPREGVGDRLPRVRSWTASRLTSSKSQGAADGSLETGDSPSLPGRGSEQLHSTDNSAVRRK